jgi:hypothetical protein
MPKACFQHGRCCAAPLALAGRGRGWGYPRSQHPPTRRPCWKHAFGMTPPSPQGGGKRINASAAPSAWTGTASWSCRLRASRLRSARGALPRGPAEIRPAAEAGDAETVGVVHRAGLAWRRDRAWFAPHDDDPVSLAELVDGGSKQRPLVLRTLEDAAETHRSAVATEIPIESERFARWTGVGQWVQFHAHSLRRARGRGEKAEPPTWRIMDSGGGDKDRVS